MRELFPEVLGTGSIVIFLIVFVVFFLLGYFLIFKIHELIFYKEERTKIEEIQGRVKYKKIEHRKNLFKRGKVEEIKTVVISSRKLGDIRIEDEIFYKKLDKKDLVKVLYQKKYLVRRFKKDAKYLGLHIVDIMKRKF